MEHINQSELRVMNLLWKNGNMTARELAAALGESVGWSKTTTYTVIKNCIEKGAIIRTEPNFMCSAAVAKEEVQEIETENLVEKLFDGSPDMLISALLSSKKLSGEKLDHIHTPDPVMLEIEELKRRMALLEEQINDTKKET